MFTFLRTVHNFTLGSSVSLLLSFAAPGLRVSVQIVKQMCVRISSSLSVSSPYCVTWQSDKRRAYQCLGEKNAQIQSYVSCIRLSLSLSRKERCARRAQCHKHQAIREWEQEQQREREWGYSRSLGRSSADCEDVAPWSKYR